VERNRMNEHDRPETEHSGSTHAPGGSGWLDGVIAGFMTEELTDAVDAAANPGSTAEEGASPRAWVAEGRSRIDDTLALLLAPIMRKAMEEASAEVVARLERIESRLDAIERSLSDH
jgi:hypothetical protein